jgi:feruloyl esterase
VNFLGLPFAMGFNFDTDAPKIFATSGVYTESSMSFMTPTDVSNMSSLYSKGGKLLIYQGTADPVFSFNDTLTWLSKVRNYFGGATDRFTKFYPIPGMSHCSGGPATDQFDIIEPLVNWVEKGIEPGAIVASARGTGTSSIAALINAEIPTNWSPSRTRPLCVYPKVATYNGSGDVESASSFTCQ